jgi:DUF4097 and DUF4098 domain-containing protein YvlB
MPDVRVQASSESGVLRFDATPIRLTLRDESDAEHGRSRGNASYDVSVPRGIRLRLHSVSGSVTASGSQGEVAVTTVGGAIDVTGGRRQVALESVSGSIKASQITGELRAQSVSGNVRADNVSGRLEATTVTGSIRLTGLRANDIRAETANGDIVYTGRIATGGIYDFESHSGGIRLTVPSSTAAQFRLDAFKGTVQSDFGADVAPTARSPRGGRVEFTTGDGRARVMARTFSGRIVVKSDVATTVRRDSIAVIRTDSGPVVRKDSAAAARKDSASVTRRDSTSVHD